MTVIPDRSDWLTGLLPTHQGQVFYSLINETAEAGVSCENLNIVDSIPLGKFSSIFLTEVVTNDHVIKLSSYWS